MRSLIGSLTSSFALILLVTASYATTGQNTTMASGMPIISVYPLKVEALPYEHFSVNVTVTDVENLYAWELKLQYDIDILVPQLPPMEGPFLKTGGCSTYLAWTHDARAGIIRVAATRLGKVPGVSGNGTLVSIEFYAFQIGDCLFDLFGTVLFDSELLPVDHATQDGYFTVPVSADLIQRRSWTGRHRFSITRDKVGVQTVYGKVKNLGDWDCYVRVEFKVVDEFDQPIGVFQAKHVVQDAEVTVVPGESVVLSVDLWETRETAWRPGKYYVQATCVHSAGNILWEYGIITKSFSFAVVP